MKVSIALRRAAWPGVAAWLVWLSSCTSTATNGQGVTTGYDKTIEVAVANNTIQVPETAANVPAGQPGVVKWKFASGTTGYLFPSAGGSAAPGIVFKLTSATLPTGCTNTPDPATVFHNCNAKQGGTEFHCNAKKTDAGNCYAYTVTVVPATSGTSTPPPLDPWIRSQ